MPVVIIHVFGVNVRQRNVGIWTNNGQFVVNPARTIEENIRLSELPKSKTKYNVSHKPLFMLIPLTHVVIDNIHLFLCVSDILIDRLIIEMKRHDAIDKIKKLTSFNPVKHRHLHVFEEFVASLNIINFRFFVGQNSKMLKHRSLTGPEKLKAFRNIQIPEMLPKFNEEEFSFYGRSC